MARRNYNRRKGRKRKVTRLKKYVLRPRGGIRI